MIEQYLNKRWSLRKLSDSEFDEILPTLAEELAQVDYRIQYSDEDLQKDWQNLKKFTCESTTLNSTTRAGMKLLEHFQQNIWQVSSSGSSFADLWTKENLIKVLRWNRNSHSTPYLSELRRGLYLSTNLNKVTMYRPTMAKIICDDCKPQVVFDPCVGWGGRMLGAVAAGASYIGVEPCKQTYYNLLDMIKLLKLPNVTLHNDTVENIPIPESQLVITSPPYFDLEIYDTDENQSIVKYPDYSSWQDKFLIKTIVRCLEKAQYSCWNVAKYLKYDLPSVVKTTHTAHDFTLWKEYKLNSSKRPTNGIGRKDDITYCFRRG